MTFASGTPSGCVMSVARQPVVALARNQPANRLQASGFATAGSKPAPQRRLQLLPVALPACCQDPECTKSKQASGLREPIVRAWGSQINRDHFVI